jgi:hypothetical protein
MVDVSSTIHEQSRLWSAAAWLPHSKDAGLPQLFTPTILSTSARKTKKLEIFHYPSER